MCTFNPDEHALGRSGFSVILRKGHPLFEIFEQILDHLPFGIGELIKDTEWFRQFEKTWVGEVSKLPVSDIEASHLARPFWAAVHKELLDDWPEEDE